MPIMEQIKLINPSTPRGKNRIIIACISLSFTIHPGNRKKATNKTAMTANLISNPGVASFIVFRTVSHHSSKTKSY